MHSDLAAATKAIALALAATLVLAATGCGKPSTPAPEATAPAQSAATETPATTAAEQAAAAETEARELELQARQVELELRERELAAKEAAAQTAARTVPAPKAATVPKPAAARPAPAAAAPPPPVTVSAGTQLSVKFISAYSTKTAAPGATVNAELASDLLVDGRRVAKAGAALSGSVTEVISGSRKIGAVPALTIDFTQLVVADGRTTPVAIRVVQTGASEKGRDTAKIVGGTAAGAIIGHQIDDDKGKVIGGIIGGAAGAIGAQKTGTEAEIAAGSVLPASVRAAFTYDGK